MSAAGNMVDQDLGKDTDFRRRFGRNWQLRKVYKSIGRPCVTITSEPAQSCYSGVYFGGEIAEDGNHGTNAAVTDNEVLVVGDCRSREGADEEVQGEYEEHETGEAGERVHNYEGK